LDELVRQAAQAYRLHRDVGLPFADIGARLGISTATAWRRFRWWADWGLPTHHGRDVGPLPVIRRTTAPPRRPRLPLLDPGPELMRLEPRPGVRCRARRRRDRQPCRAYAIHGGTVCRLHGGAAPQVREAARARHTSDKARLTLARLGG
jgi:hypothetical protein